MDVNSLPKTVTQQRCDCDLNPGPSADESSMLTIQLPIRQARWDWGGICVHSAQLQKTVSSTAPRGPRFPAHHAINLNGFRAVAAASTHQAGPPSCHPTITSALIPVHGYGVDVPEC